jgi:hypothetical protein
LDRLRKNYKKYVVKITGLSTQISKMVRAGNEAGVPTAPKSYGNTIRVWKMSRLKNLTFNVSVVQPSVLLQDSIGVT